MTNFKTIGDACGLTALEKEVTHVKRLKLKQDLASPKSIRLKEKKLKFLFQGTVLLFSTQINAFKYYKSQNVGGNTIITLCGPKSGAFASQMKQTQCLQLGINY